MAKVETKKKQTNPNKYETNIKPYLQDIKKYREHGVTEEQIYTYYGVGKTQWTKYKKMYSELSELLYNGLKTFKMNLVNKAYEVAQGYYYEESTTTTTKDKDGNILSTTTKVHKKYSKADGNMIQFLLINRFPKEFSKSPKDEEKKTTTKESQESTVETV